VRETVSLQSLRSVPELKYASSAENVARYRAIMRFFYQEYKRLRYWLRPEEIYAGIMAWGVLPDYTLEQCQADLEQLVEWGNLSSRHDGGRSATVEEYLKKKMQYQLRPYSIEIERLLETLEKVTGYGGSLEPTLFDRIIQLLTDIRLKDGQFAPGEALELWNRLYESFVRLHENAADYMASLQTAKAEEMMVTEAFLVFKEKLTDYLQNFVQALQRSAYKIEGNLLQISGEVKDRFLERVADDELDKPRLEELPSRESLLAELNRGWENLRRWFIGDGVAPSELTMLERATKEAIARIVRCVIRIQERRRSGVSRRKELEYLAQWFYRLNDVDEAHRLAAYAFGLFPTRHLQGEDLRESDRADLSMWEESPNLRTLRSRSRKRIGRQGAEPVPDHGEKRRRTREAYLRRQEEERKLLEDMLRRGSFRISELGTVKAGVRLKLLEWISRCNTSPGHSFVTAEGVQIRMTNHGTEERAVLVCEDGELNMPDYHLTFALLASDAGMRDVWPDTAQEVAATGEGETG